MNRLLIVSSLQPLPAAWRWENLTWLVHSSGFRIKVSVATRFPVRPARAFSALLSNLRRRTSSAAAADQLEMARRIGGGD